MTLKGGSSHACAACKYQRRKCSSECPLAPYFPSHQPKMFQNAHKLFGVSNILKILKNLDANQKGEAMKSIIYEANMRERFPVHGCLWVIRQLQYQIWQEEEELQAVLDQLEMCRQHHQHQVSLITDDLPSMLELGMAPPSNALSLFKQTPQHYNDGSALPMAQQCSYSLSSSVGYNNSPYLDSKDDAANSLWLQHPYTAANNNSAMEIQSQLVSSDQPLAIQHEVVQDYDEIHPFFETIDDRQSYIDTKEAYESSSEESLKDTTQSTEHVVENDLKSAAACFSLTSVN
ncbi:DUF260 domain-containing protein [Cephalotus follicularis]|uniref:DUF260 domain-containing protein n=1 Tax=Cephalotus follicularis TaxID=3775 RepID=A0A1Q3BG35_CEPFO|nr:DUF260 domain-containing protein [Cephalotus follicularis]